MTNKYYKKWYQKKKESDPEWYERHIEKNRIRQACPDYRAKHNERQKERYRADPDYRAKVAESSRKWVKDNPDRHKKHLETQKEKQKERYRTDPVYRAKCIEQGKKRYKVMKRETARLVRFEWERIKDQVASTLSKLSDI